MKVYIAGKINGDIAYREKFQKAKRESRNDQRRSNSDS